MAGTREAEIGVPLFLFKDPETKKLRTGRRGDKVTLLAKDYQRLESAGGLASQRKQAQEQASLAQYDQASVEEAIALLERISEDQREEYFEHERARQRKGVLFHFDAPLWEGADDSTGGLGEYEGLKVEDAIAFLESLPEDEREPYFEHERAQDRKGVLAHFEQSTDE